MHSHLDFLARIEQDFWNRLFLGFKIQNTHVLCWTCFGQNFSSVHLLLKMDCGIHPPLLVFADERIVNFSELHSKVYCVSIDSGDSTKNVFIFSRLMQMPTI